MSRLLIVEDDPKLRATLLFQLRDAGYAPEAAESAEGALSRLEGDESPPDLLLLDVRLPGMSGVELVRRLCEQNRLPATVILSGEATIGETVEALQLGVHDFLEKPFRAERLLRSVRNALEHTSLRQKIRTLENELTGQPEILGNSEPIARLREQIERTATTDARVLILGESGTGKELVADALHRQSPRRNHPFIKVNCAAIAPQLIEDELFGHARGAFTDARSDKSGLFEEANGGSLFLDEIGDMDLSLQARLLRVLEDGHVRRVGETRERAVNVRVIAATHTDLEAAVEQGRFRQDLFFRLAGVPLEVPPLRQRGADIELLFEHFVDLYSRRHRARSRRIAPEVFAVLEAYPWPGNVRELSNLCERLVVLGTDPIDVKQLPEPYRNPRATLTENLLAMKSAEPILPLRDFRARVEKEYLEAVLESTGWNVSAAARALGIQRTHLHQRLVTLGSKRPPDR